MRAAVRSAVRSRRAAGRPPLGDAGNVVVEFLGGTLLLLVPLLYLVTTLASVQRATFAVEGAAREAARAVVTSPRETAEERTRTAVRLALDDQGLDPALADDAVAVRCDPDCTGARSVVTVEVALEVALPLVPSALADVVPLSVPVSSTVTAPVDTFRAPDAPSGREP